VWKQFVDAAVQVDGQAFEDIAEVSPTLMPVEFGRLHQTSTAYCAISSASK
jgi:hypothetical protein